MPVFNFSRAVGIVAGLALATLGSIGAAQAQTRATPPQAAAQNAATLSPNPNDFVSTAFRIAMAVEQDQSAPIWDNASSVMKTIAGRDQFVNTLRQKVASNGPLKSFTWRSVMRVQMQQQQGQLPAGQYLTVNFVGINKSNQAVAETVSFILEGDQKWRLVGLTFS